MRITLNRRNFIILIELLFNYYYTLTQIKMRIYNIKIAACLRPDAGAASCP
jgi:hypothetical protein